MMAESAHNAHGGANPPEQQQTIIIKTPPERKLDVFDSEDFDATRFINQIYPDGEQRSRWGPHLTQRHSPAFTTPPPSSQTQHNTSSPSSSQIAEASLGDLDRFIEMLKKQVRQKQVAQ